MLLFFKKTDEPDFADKTLMISILTVVFQVLT